MKAHLFAFYFKNNRQKKTTQKRRKQNFVFRTVHFRFVQMNFCFLAHHFRRCIFCAFPFIFSSCDFRPFALISFHFVSRMKKGHTNNDRRETIKTDWYGNFVSILHVYAKWIRWSSLISCDVKTTTTTNRTKRNKTVESEKSEFLFSFSMSFRSPNGDIFILISMWPTKTTSKENWRRLFHLFLYANFALLNMNNGYSGIMIKISLNKPIYESKRDGKEEKKPIFMCTQLNDDVNSITILYASLWISVAFAAWLLSSSMGCQSNVKQKGQHKMNAKNKNIKINEI